jgi:hypothetical protein
MNNNISAISITINPGHDELMLKWLDSLSSINKSLNLSVFSSSYNVNQPLKKFTVLPLYEAKYHTGTAFVWDLLSLELILDFPNIHKIVYYQNNNLPWLQNRYIGYAAWAKIFDNDRVSIMVDNPTIQQIFKLTWKEPHLINEMTPEKLYEVLR